MKNPGIDIIVGLNIGDETVFQAVFKKYHHALYFFVRRLTDDRVEAQDIVSETMAKLWRLRENFRTEANVKAFLFITARNASLDFLRFRKKKQGKTGEILQELIHANANVENLIAEVEPIYEADLVGTVIAALEDLPAKQREVLEMIIYEGLNDQEVAARLNKSTKTVQNLKSIAVGYLRSNIDHNKLSPAVSLTFYCLLSQLL